MAHPLYVAFTWHQHQPDYRDPHGGPARLPWARLHAVKDYLHMAELVADFPAIHCTFNFVPSLVDQLVAIGDGRYVDQWQLLSLKEAWTPEDKRFLLDNFFSIHPRILTRYPAYARLRDQRRRPDLPDQYFIDLAVWFNLAWIDARAIARDETLRALVQKGERYTRADIATVLDRHRAIAARIVPFHHALAERAQIELSVSPYYHPILPLLIDQRSASEAIPSLTLPATRLACPEDASEQLRRAVDAHRSYFGYDPAGLWPSEGSVSDGLLPLVRDSFRWMASDEIILARSLGIAIGRDRDGNVTNPRVLYQPYASPRPPVRRRPGQAPTSSTAPELSLIFRDHFISDRIGFGYQYLSARDAVQELMWRLRTIRERIADQEHGYLVSIILDGENAWESYEDNGDPFFRELYKEVSEDAWLRAVTVNEYLRENPARDSIKHLAAGSWINGNFDTWIGEPAQNRAWEWLAQTRAALSRWLTDYAIADETVLAHAWDELYIAEGSDWFWWYSSHNHSAQSAMFDELFRGHLQNIYTTIGLPVPDELKQPIRSTEEQAVHGITTFISPRLTADDMAGDEWRGAAEIEPGATTGAMQQANVKLSRVLYGYNQDELFFRIEARVELAPLRVALYLSTPHEEHCNSRPRDTEAGFRLALGWELAIDPNTSSVQVYHAEGQEVWRPAPVRARATVRGRVVEVAVSRQDLGLEKDDAVGFVVALAQESQLVETLPVQGLQPFSLLEL